MMIRSAARDPDLPVEFFARVIWQESRFRADAVGAGDATTIVRRGWRNSCRAPRPNAACSIRFDRCRRCRNRRSF